MPRKTPSTANAVPLPREGGLGDIMHKIGVCGLGFDGTADRVWLVVLRFKAFCAGNDDFFTVALFVEYFFNLWRRSVAWVYKIYIKVQ